MRIPLVFFILVFFFQNVFAQMENEKEELMVEMIKSIDLLGKNTELASNCVQMEGSEKCYIFYDLYQSSMTDLEHRYSDLMSKTNTVMIEELMQNCRIVIDNGDNNIVPECLGFQKEYNKSLELIIRTYPTLLN